MRSCKKNQNLNMASSPQPSVVIVLCGKRKSGKDYVAAQLEDKLQSVGVSVLRLSKPLKKQYAEEHGLDLEKLMDSSPYKESYRQSMIVWGEEIRNKDPGYFCCLATAEATQPVWLVCDARRPTDMEYFKTHYGSRTITVRVEAGEGVRGDRGWVFTPGVDDAPSECGLDQYQCDVMIRNDGTPAEGSGGLEEQLQRIIDIVQTRL